MLFFHSHHLKKQAVNYYRKHGQLYIMDDFMEQIKNAEKQGEYLFNSGSSALEIVNGKLQLSEALFQNMEDVSIDKHPPYNSEFIHQHLFLRLLMC